MSDMAKVRLDYYKVTATDGDKELFINKLMAINDSIDEPSREYKVGDSYYNFTFEIDETSHSIFGHIRQLRTSAVPSKGRVGTNDTSQIPLQENEGISEKTYFLYHYKKNKLVINYNHHGPRIGGLFRLINNLYKEKIISGLSGEKRVRYVRSSYVPYLLGSEIELALRSNKITCIQVRPKTPVESGETTGDESFPEICEMYSDFPAEVTKEIILKDKEGRLKRIFGKFLRRKEDIEHFDKFRVEMVNPETETIDEYDLIKNKLQERVSVSLREDSRELDEVEMKSVMKSNFKAVSERYGW